MKRLLWYTLWCLVFGIYGYLKCWAIYQCGSLWTWRTPVAIGCAIIVYRSIRGANEPLEEERHQARFL